MLLLFWGTRKSLGQRETFKGLRFTAAKADTPEASQLVWDESTGLSWRHTGHQDP